MTNPDWDPEDPRSILWARRHFAMLREGGVWGVPRSGLLFRKRGDRLVLTDAMPWEPAMATLLTEDELAVQQDTELEGIRRAFGAAGVEVLDERG